MTETALKSDTTQRAIPTGAVEKIGVERIPIVREVLADLDTPLSVYLKLAAGPYSYLFESVQGGEKWGRYSIIGLPCRRRYTINGRRLACFDYGRLLSEEELDDPLARIDQLRGQYRVPDLDELPARDDRAPPRRVIDGRPGQRAQSEQHRRRVVEIAVPVREAHHRGHVSRVGGDPRDRRLVRRQKRGTEQEGTVFVLPPKPDWRAELKRVFVRPVTLGRPE